MKCVTTRLIPALLLTTIARIQFHFRVTFTPTFTIPQLDLVSCEEVELV